VGQLSCKMGHLKIGQGVADMQDKRPESSGATGKLRQMTTILGFVFEFGHSPVSDIITQ
jgi:hypothetical protein